MPIWLENLSWQALLPGSDQIIRIAMAVALGGLVGLEREIRDKPAGFRTIILISVGACLFTMLSQQFGGPDWNTTRIAAQIVTGIGFLGAGAIIRGRSNVFGLTTAATIWTVAAIGMAAGFGALRLAGFGTIIILVALFIFDSIEHAIGKFRDIQNYRIAAPKSLASIEEISKMFRASHVQPRRESWHEEAGSVVIDIRAMGSKANHRTLRLQLIESDRFRLIK